MPSNSKPKSKVRAVHCITCTRGGKRFEAQPGDDMTFLSDSDRERLLKSGAIAKSDG